MLTERRLLFYNPNPALGRAIFNMYFTFVSKLLGSLHQQATTSQAELDLHLIFLEVRFHLCLSATSDVLPYRRTRSCLYIRVSIAFSLYLSAQVRKS